jgi:hypothetical protein
MYEVSRRKIIFEDYSDIGRKEIVYWEENRIRLVRQDIVI